jgi:NAD(P)-dependent dehydrogenase (short-subunit alcohol dehydrogenase family)
MARRAGSESAGRSRSRERRLEGCGASEAGWGRDGLSKLSPLKRAGAPAESAQLAVFLGSDRSTFVTGETINVDGGIHLNWGDVT